MKLGTRLRAFFRGALIACSTLVPIVPMRFAGADADWMTALCTLAGLALCLVEIARHEPGGREQ